MKLNHKFDWENNVYYRQEIKLKIKETIHSISDKNHINIISYSLPEILTGFLNRRTELTDILAPFYIGHS